MVHNINDIIKAKREPIILPYRKYLYFMFVPINWLITWRCTDKPPKVMIVDARMVLCIIDIERVPRSFSPIVISIMLFIITSV